jgi:hypothetical protein
LWTIFDHSEIPKAANLTLSDALPARWNFRHVFQTSAFLSIYRRSLKIQNPARLWQLMAHTSGGAAATHDLCPNLVSAEPPGKRGRHYQTWPPLGDRDTICVRDGCTGTGTRQEGVRSMHRVCDFDRQTAPNQWTQPDGSRFVGEFSTLVSRARSTGDG